MPQGDQALFRKYGTVQREIERHACPISPLALSSTVNIKSNSTRNPHGCVATGVLSAWDYWAPLTLHASVSPDHLLSHWWMRVSQGGGGEAFWVTVYYLTCSVEPSPACLSSLPVQPASPAQRSHDARSELIYIMPVLQGMRGWPWHA